MKQNSKQLLGLVAVALISSGATIGLHSFIQSKNNHTQEEQLARPISFASVSQSKAIQTDFTLAAENSVHSVVHIRSIITRTKSTRAQSRDPFFDFFFGPQGSQMPNQRPQEGFGSGVIISQDGYIVTNNHVIDKADQIEVTLNNKKSYPAKLVGTDPSTDIALLKIDGNDFKAIPFGDSDNLKVGEWVLAVGNPFNLTSTVTAGIVSAKARNINILANAGSLRIESFIQTDAAVNPGNSGGALVNTQGELIGINTAIASETGNYAGYSFAVPISIASKVVTDLKQYGSVQRAILGVSIADINSDLQKERKLETLNGVFVANVVERGSAAEAGIAGGDIITAINDIKTKSVAELQEQVSRYRPGDKIRVSIIRGKENKNITVTLKNNQGNTDVIIAKNGIESLGAKFEPISENIKKQLGLRSGLQITELKNGKMSDAGIKNGFIILRANNQRITKVEELESIIKQIQQSSPGEQGLFIVGVYPNGKTSYYAIDIAE
ncbi:MAG: Do family serine endopeptidase [Bacteroidales bacterium]